MATVALSLAGQVVGGLVGGPFGATIGRALGALAGSAVDSALFGQENATRPVADIRITGASEGAAIPRLYGWSRLAGTVIWATDLERIAAEDGGAKGFAPAEDEEVVASFALGLCEGKIAHVGRIWADGALLETADLTIRTYRGTGDQEPDGFMLAMQGDGAVPGYRGLAYLVFERLPLKRFGNRLPNLSVEVCRPAGDLEKDIRAVCVIPGSTEFGYDPEPRLRVLGPGKATGENLNASGLRADWDVSIDELTALCPNLEHVGLVVSWFGTDLRCGQCVVEPRVEGAGKTVTDANWAVAGRSRTTASVVSSHDGGPAYGGTPDDASVMAAITDLRARGLKVTLYPFVMMDIAADNTLPDPYGGARQAAYPWRGRITCDPAPGRPGTVDQTPAAAPQVAAFVDSGYRDMVLHYAGLAEAAGGVEAFLIGSELVGLTTVRDSATGFPFVDALRELAGEVRAILRPETAITYGADWTEYHGYQPPDAPGDKLFHLDTLWGDPAIDAVGIDNYIPLSDWRGSGEGPDADRARSGYDLDYIAANIAGGEGFDWYYASDADRQAGMRTPITDGAHGEAWVFRVKDLAAWWANPHHDRVGGMRSPTPTAWVPASKPVWMTEIGCGAIDKGANAPNAFGDPKSAEDQRPYFSNGAPDALMQRQALRAIHSHWQTTGAHNPEGMVDGDRLYVWCWDARPFPAFPDRDDVWADAANYATGHWLNGRLGGAGAEEMIAAMAADYGVAMGAGDAAAPLVTGCAVDAVTSLREASAPLLAASGLMVSAENGGLRLVAPDVRTIAVIDPDDLVAPERGPVMAQRRADPTGAAGRLTLTTLDRGRDYQTGSVIAVAAEGDAMAAEGLALVLDPGAARQVAERRLALLGETGDTLELTLPPEHLGLTPGALIALPGYGDAPFVIEEIADAAGFAVTARAWRERPVTVLPDPVRRGPRSGPVLVVAPLVVAAQVPREGTADGASLLVGAYAQPWPGSVMVETAAGQRLARLERRAAIGELLEALPVGSSVLWCEAETTVRLYAGHLANSDRLDVLGGSNRIAVAGEAGWEILGFATAELVAPGEYRLGGLLRGQGLTTPVAAAPGARVLVLDSAVARIDVPDAAFGAIGGLRAYGGPRDAVGTVLDANLDIGPALLLAPVHLRARRTGGDVVLSWLRRTRIGGDLWPYGEVPLDASPERYRVTVFDGATAVRTLEADAPEVTYDAAMQVADFGGPVDDIDFAVAQVSAVTGPGNVARRAVALA